MGVFDRSLSECSDDIDIRPLELTDLQRGISSDEQDESTLIKREGDYGDASQNHHSSHGDKFFSVVYGLKKKDINAQKNRMLIRMAWKNAYNKVKALKDPWAKFDIAQFKTEKAKRYRYKALQKKWVTDEVFIKMDTKPFNHGAMRECFRMKKLSNFSHDDWSKAHNYVAKRYMDASTCSQTYYDDVKLQMDAKLWGEEYNRHNPPKKVDIFQMAVLELVERPGSPLFHVEHFIEGSYVKYNSNSGYVCSKMRMTPHAFSHFTFERSGHELIVVDVQGVGDLYTDPQIHTAHGTDYGDGNLGTRGMALFFHSHACNSICRSLGLTEFDLAPSEIQKLKDAPSTICSKTRVRGTEELVEVPTEEQRSDLHEYLRQRSQSSGCFTQEDDTIIAGLNIGPCDSLDENFDESEDSAVGLSNARLHRAMRVPRYHRGVSNSSDERDQKYGGRKRRSGNSESALIAQQHLLIEHQDGLDDSDYSTPSICVSPQSRLRFDSSSSECDSVTRAELFDFSAMVSRRSRPSHIVLPELQQDFLLALDIPRCDSVNTILGQVHLDMAKYYELNRFSEEGEQEYDKEAAVFHVMQAASCGLVEGLLAAAQLLLDLPHYILPDAKLDDEQRDKTQGFRFLEEACRAGDRWSIVFVATALQEGTNLPPGRSRNWAVANVLYEKALSDSGVDDEGGYDAVMDTPNYTLKARQAAMYLDGGHGLDKDPNRAGELYSEAAELATEAMKGKLAAKYYMDAEMAWGQCEE
ncbi:MHCK/EF2 kinase [Trinorchestia longiramus]|nr:MHCK/EF2 kinase [Trinorchestia longiramus]